MILIASIIGLFDIFSTHNYLKFIIECLQMTGKDTLNVPACAQVCVYKRLYVQQTEIPGRQYKINWTNGITILMQVSHRNPMLFKADDSITF